MAFFLKTIFRLFRAVARRRPRTGGALLTRGPGIVPGSFHHLSVAGALARTTPLFPSPVLTVLLDMMDDPASGEEGRGGERRLPFPVHFDLGIVRAYVDLLLKGDLPPAPPPSPHASHFAYLREWDDFVRFMGSEPLPYPWSPWLASVFAADRRLGRSLMAELLRKLDMARGGGEGEAGGGRWDPWRGLVKLSGRDRAPDARYRVGPIDLAGAAFLEPAGGGAAANRGASSSKFDPRSLPNPKKGGWKRVSDIPWFARAQTRGAGRPCGVVLAGGAVMSLHKEGKMMPGQDHDWFIVHTQAGEQDAEQVTEDIMATIHEFISSISAAIGVEFPDTCAVKATLCSNRHLTLLAVNMLKDGVMEVLQKHQLILRVYPSVAHVPYGFDIDLCGMVYDGDTLWCTPGCKRALVNDFILFDHTTMSTSSVSRYHKYFRRYGVRLLFPGIPHDLLRSAMAGCDHERYAIMSEDERRKVPRVFRMMALRMKERREKPLIGRPPMKRSLPKNEMGVLQLLFAATAGSSWPGLMPSEKTDYDERLWYLMYPPGEVWMDEEIRTTIRSTAAEANVRDAGFRTFTGSFNPVQTEPFDIHTELCSSD